LAFINQKLQFEEYVGVQSEEGSHQEPSQEQKFIFLATTIQFQAGIIGASHKGGKFQAIAGGQKHMEVHTPHVKVGVIDNLKKFKGYPVHNRHHAQIGAGGQMKGSGQIGVGKELLIAENTGNHSVTIKPSQTVFHINTGSFQGANGAQFNGVAKQEAFQQVRELSIS
jgi:hypothetical protein